MADQSYADLCRQMIADLEAQLPIAREGQKAELRRAISRWRRAEKRPIVEAPPQPRKRKSIPPGHWRLRRAR